MRINGFTKICGVLLVIVGGLLALNWPFQTPKSTHAVGGIYPTHTVAAHDIVSSLLSNVGALAIGIVLIVVLFALFRVRKGK